MPNPETEDPLRPIVRTSQIIVASLISGPLIFLTVAFLLAPIVAPRAAPAPGPPGVSLALIFNGLVIAFGAAAIVMSFILPPLVSANGRKAAVNRRLAQNTAGGTGKGGKLQPIEEIQTSLIPQFPAQLIVGAAILEGAMFFAGVATLLVGGLIAPAIAIVLMIVLIARFPTESRAQLWLDQQREKLRDEEFTAKASP
jgi:hypothetical protein